VLGVIILDRMRAKTVRGLAIAAVAAAAAAIGACSNAPTLPPADQPLGKETLSLLGKKGMEPGAPMFMRIFKEET